MKQCSIAGLFLFFYPWVVLATDFECSSSVTYQWEYHLSESTQATKGKKKQAGSEEAIKKFTVDYSKRTTSGITEEEARRSLVRITDKDIVDARSVCSRNHENLSGCIAGKFQSMASVLRQLGFSARTELESVIQADCRMQTGRCISAEASEPVCVNHAPEEEAVGEEPEKNKGRKK